MGAHPRYRPNSKLRAKLFAILGDETARTIIRRTNDRACTQQWLISNVDPKAKNRIGNILEWFSVVGILDGSAKYGYRLAVGELVDVFDLVQQSPMKHPLWDTLATPVGRAVLAALVHEQRTRNDLNTLGPSKAVGNELRVLRAGQVVERTRDGRVMWWTLLEPARYSMILGRMGLIVTHLGNQLAAGGIEDVRAMAYPSGPADDYEPDAREARRPPDTVSRPLTEVGEDSTADQRAATRIWRDLADPGLANPEDIAQARRALVRIPRRPFPWADIVPEDTNYIDIPGVADGLLQSLLPMPSGELGRLIHAMAEITGTRERLPPRSPGQVRGLLRDKIRTESISYAPSDLHLPRIAWVGTGSSLGFVARFDPDVNQLDINFGWFGLISLMEEWFEQPASVLNWIQRTVMLQYALKLVRCVVSHENKYADLTLDAGVPELSEDILRIAAHWTTAERDELRRRINQHRSAYGLKSVAATYGEANNAD